MALIALDTMANTLCMLITQRMAGRRLRAGKALAAALTGALGAQAVRRLGLSRAGMLLLAMPMAYLLAGISCGQWRLRNAALLLAACGLVGGTVSSLHGAAGSLPAAWLLGALAVIAMTVSLLRARRAACDVRRARVTVRIGGYDAAFEAMVDSGNCLRDYLTHRPVIVLPLDAQTALGLCSAPLRPIFADTAGGRQMMRCFTPEETIVEAGGQRLRVAACVALSPGMPARAPALLPQSLLAQNQGM